MASSYKEAIAPSDQQDKDDIEFLARLFSLESENKDSSDSNSNSNSNNTDSHQQTPSNTSNSGSVSSQRSQPVKMFDENTWPLTLKASFVNHYVFGDVIGTGSYAEVRESLNSLTLERCAVKIVNKSYLAKRVPQGLSNQLREIHVLRMLSHENIINMKECIIQSKHIYLVLEYCSCSLQELLDLKTDTDHCLAEWECQNYFKQLINGMEYMHSHGIIHRDIKPHNLLINNDRCLKIIDYGVSCILDLGKKSDICSNYEGSPLFQAPEVVSGQKEYGGFKVDIWSAGVTLYLMACGKHPFDDEALLGLYDRILGEELSVPVNVNEALSHLFHCVLDKDCDRRYSIMQIRLHPWMSCPLARPDRNGAGGCLDEPIFPPRATGDIYRSMTILPYLYSHHYPTKSPTRSPSRSASSTRSSGYSVQDQQQQQVVSKVPSTAPSSLVEGNTSISAASTTNTSTTGSIQPAESSTSGGSETSGQYPQGSIVSSREEMGNLWSDSDDIEWGTEEQYKQMKLPSIRVNRQVRRRDRIGSFWSRFLKFL